MPRSAARKAVVIVFFEQETINLSSDDQVVLGEQLGNKLPSVESQAPGIHLMDECVVDMQCVVF